MSEERLEPLDAELAALVDAERARPDLPAGAEGRLLERLERSIANADDAGGGPGRGGGGESGGGVGGGSGGVGGAGRLARFFSRRLPFGVTAFALGGLAGAGLHAVVRRPPPPAPPPIVERAPAPSPTAAATPASPAAAPPASPAAAPDVAAPGGSPE